MRYSSLNPLLRNLLKTTVAFGIFVVLFLLPEFSLWAQDAPVDPLLGGDPTVDSPATEADNATEPTTDPSFTLMDGASDAIVSSFVNLPALMATRGLQFKNPVVSPGVSYRNYVDHAAGGFSGNEFGGSFAMDVDIYDGLLTGLYYQYLYRGGHNLNGTSEQMHSNGISFYTGKRFFDIINVGLSYNFASADHRLTRAVNLNLDRDSQGFMMLAGLSQRNGKWNWNLTPSFGYVYDDYARQKALETGRVTVGGGLGYDFTKWLTVGAAFSYNNFVFQGTFPNTQVRDDDYWTLGPRVQFFPTDRITVNVSFDSMQGYKQYSSYLINLSVDISF